MKEILQDILAGGAVAIFSSAIPALIAVFYESLRRRNTIYRITADGKEIDIDLEKLTDKEAAKILSALNEKIK